MTTEINRQQQLDGLNFFNYVDNWLFHSWHNSQIRQSIDLVDKLSQTLGYSISQGKTWVASTAPKARKAMSTWFNEPAKHVFVHKEELGCLLHFTRQLTIDDVIHRWEDGLERISSMIHQKWPAERKTSIILQGIFPQVFSGVETVHVSLSTLKKFRAKLNVAMVGRKSQSSHFLTPLFTSGTNYEPFLYIFRTRISNLRSTLLSFSVDINQLWNDLCNIDLNKTCHRIHGPIANLLWCCQILGWGTVPGLTTVTSSGEKLHILHSPLDSWFRAMEMDWFKYALDKFRLQEKFPGTIFHISTWKSFWNKCSPLPPLSLSFRTFAILTGSAVAKTRVEKKTPANSAVTTTQGRSML